MYCLLKARRVKPADHQRTRLKCISAAESKSAAQRGKIGRENTRPKH
jgi:hypothetical protein